MLLPSLFCLVKRRVGVKMRNHQIISYYTTPFVFANQGLWNFILFFQGKHREKAGRVKDHFTSNG